MIPSYQIIHWFQSKLNLLLGRTFDQTTPNSYTFLESQKILNLNEILLRLYNFQITDKEEDELEGILLEAQQIYVDTPVERTNEIEQMLERHFVRK